MPIENDPTHGEIFVTSTGERIQINQTKIKPVSDGSRRLDWNAIRNVPVPDRPVKMRPSWPEEPRLEIDTPEYKQKYFGKKEVPWLKCDGPRGTLETIRPASWDYTDPDELRGLDDYHLALTLRSQGLPYDQNVITLHQSPEWRDPSFRAAYYERERSHKRKNG